MAVGALTLEDLLITFNDVLRSAGVDSGTVRLARHQDQRVRGTSIYAVWKSEGGRKKVEEYQAVQSKPRFQVGGFVASFLVTPAPRNETMFIGLYQVEGVGVCEQGSIDPLSGKDVSNSHRYQMRYDDRLAEYQERLSIDWGKANRTWVQVAARHPKKVTAIREPETPPFPGFSRFCADISHILGLHPSWQERLRETKGVYLLVDKNTGKQYVGSAKGEDSLWGRFCDYARTGHGGNVEMRNRPGAQYQVSVLQIVDQQLPDHRIEEIESWWKEKLMTRQHGLNRN